MWRSCCCGRRPASWTLEAAQPDALINQRLFDPVTWDSRTCSQSFHLFVNKSSEPLQLYWLSNDTENLYGKLQPGKTLYVGTFSFHVWRVKGPKGRIVCEVTGTNTIVQVAPDLTSTVEQEQLEPAGVHTEGRYYERARQCGIPIMAFDCVCDEAIQAAAGIVSNMLGHASREVLQRMLTAGAQVAIIGRNQAVTDIPPHRFMKHNVDRDIDASARGLGGTAAVPTTSAGEENVLMLRGQKYWCQSVLVHELGHAVLNLGLEPAQVAHVCQLYKAACKRAAYLLDCYMMSNEQEYWATAVEAWFESTSRTDVNGGINTRNKLWQADPGLAGMLEAVFGNRSWRFHHDYPITAATHSTAGGSSR